MAVNKKHPDYPAYIEKCKELAAREAEEINNLPSPEICSALDAGRMGEIHTKYNKKLKELQAKYKHLF